MYRLKYLTIKPTTLCGYDCPYCTTRQILLNSSNENILSIEQWTSVFHEADNLGCTYLDISGGEPTLYKNLFSLIFEAKKLGWYVSINTSGINIEKIIDKLIKLKLDKICLSIMSLDNVLNDKIRKGKNLSKKSFNGIEIISKSPITLVLHFILSKSNFRELPELIEFAFNKKIAGLAIAFPENDYINKELLMSEVEINEFIENVLPLAKSNYNKLKTHKIDFPDIFLKDLSLKQYANGIYWNSQNEITKICDKPNNFLLIYPNGDVLPCNGIEYTHKPIIGNINKSSLTEIWNNQEMNEFRNNRIDYCIFCPIKRHIGVSICKSSIPPYSEEVIKYIPINYTFES